MPNRENSLIFWKQVAQKCGNNTQIIFDLFNEPFPGNNKDTDTAWNCIKTGECLGINYPAAGMQEIVNTIRQTGAKNILMISGPQNSNSLTKWI
jgi:endoglucanase